MVGVIVVVVGIKRDNCSGQKQEWLDKYCYNGFRKGNVTCWETT